MRLSLRRAVTIFVLACAGCAPAAQTSIAPPESGLTAVASGQGQEIVLVHGALGDYRQWAPISERLKSSYRVIALSRRYHWPNSPPGQGASYTFDGHRDDLLVLLRSIGHPVHLVGHSQGAAIALMAALAEPQWVRSLTLIELPLAGAVPPATPGLDSELASRRAMGADIQRLVREGKDEAAAERLMDWVQEGSGGYARLGSRVQNDLLANARSIGPTFSTPPPNITCDQLRELRVPTLVLTGERTRQLFKLAGESATTCIPGAQAEVIPSSGHMALAENPSGTAALLSAFLARH